MRVEPAAHSTDNRTHRLGIVVADDADDDVRGGALPLQRVRRWSSNQ